MGVPNIAHWFNIQIIFMLYLAGPSPINQPKIISDSYFLNKKLG
jgi:hypothetical protein